MAKLTANCSFSCKHVLSECRMLCEQVSVPDGDKTFTLTMTEAIGQMLAKVFDFKLVTENLLFQIAVYDVHCIRQILFENINTYIFQNKSSWTFIMHPHPTITIDREVFLLKIICVKNYCGVKFLWFI